MNAACDLKPRYLKSVDKFNEWTVSAFITPGSENLSSAADSRSDSGRLDMKFILLHETRNDDGIKSFFMDVWELYVKVSVTGFSRSLLPLRHCYSDHAEPLPHRAYTDTKPSFRCARTCEREKISVKI